MEVLETVEEADRSRGRWGVVLRWAIAIALLAWVARQLGSHLALLPASAWRPDGGWLAASFLGLFGAIALGCECWRRWVVATGANLSYRAAFRVLYKANMAKYLPGVAWHFVGRVVLAGREGVPATSASLAVLMDTVGHLAGACVFIVLAATFTGAAPPLGAAAGLLVLGVALHPRSLDTALGLVGKLAGRTLPRVAYGYGLVLAMVGLYVLDWCLVGAGFTALARALTPFDLKEAPAVAVALATAWCAGALAWFAPAGLGVREAALTTLLAQSLPASSAAIIALASRVWFISAEIVAFLLALTLGEPAAPDHITPAHKT
jgi:hypothetical protein